CGPPPQARSARPSSSTARATSCGTGAAHGSEYPENLKLIETALAALVKTASAPQGNGQDEPTPKRGR
ncbi:MAG: hypothetical protein ACREVJ_11045, partial [Gammaproteobacteria bacterium]